MKKAFMGLRLKRLREEQRLTQAALAQRLGISLSYLNQLENNQRPLTVQVLLALNTAFGLDLQVFSEDDEARLIADLREALSDAAFGETIAAVELRELAMNMPAVGRALVTIHRKYRQSIEQAGLLAARLGEDRQSAVPVLPSTPFEEVRDFFYLRHNYIAELDEAAETIAQAMNFPVGQMDTALAAYLADKHGVKLVFETIDDLPSGNERKFDSRTDTLYLAAGLRPGQRAFQIGTQIAMLAFDRELTGLVDGAGFTSQEARGLAWIGLANYFAGALIMPYGRFLAAAESRRYDIELLGYEFAVGFETICHRLSTLQRDGARGVPFFFIRASRRKHIETPIGDGTIGGSENVPLWNCRALPPGTHPDAAGAHAGRANLSLDRPHGVTGPRQIRRADQEFCGSAGLRRAPCRARGVCGRHQPQGRQRNPDRNGLQGLRAPGLRAACLPADRPRAADRRDKIPIRALCHVVTGSGGGILGKYL